MLRNGEYDVQCPVVYKKRGLKQSSSLNCQDFTSFHPTSNGTVDQTWCKISPTSGAFFTLCHEFNFIYFLFLVTLLLNMIIWSDKLIIVIIIKVALTLIFWAVFFWMLDNVHESKCQWNLQGHWRGASSLLLHNDVFAEQSVTAHVCCLVPPVPMCYKCCACEGKSACVFVLVETLGRWLVSF